MRGAHTSREPIIVNKAGEARWRLAPRSTAPSIYQSAGYINQTQPPQTRRTVHPTHHGLICCGALTSWTSLYSINELQEGLPHTRAFKFLEMSKTRFAVIQICKYPALRRRATCVDHRKILLPLKNEQENTTGFGYNNIVYGVNTSLYSKPNSHRR